MNSGTFMFRMAGLTMLQTVIACGQPASCPACAPPAAPAATRLLVYDARDGSGPARVHLGAKQAARVVVINKNPFLYGYQMKLDEKVVSEPGLAAFLSLLSPFIADQLPKPLETQKALNPVKSFEMRKPDAAKCPAADPQHTRCTDQFNLIHSAGSELLVLFARTEATFNRFSQDYVPAKTALEEDGPVLRNGGATCSDLCSHADHLRTAISRYPRPDIDSALVDIEELRSQSVIQQRRIVRFRDEFPELATPIQLELERADTDISLAREYKVIDLRLQDAVKRADSLQDQINTAFSRSDSFYTLQDLGPYPLPTDVILTISRKDVDVKDAQFSAVGGNRTLNFGGGQRFVLAGGLAFAPLEKREFQRVQGFSKDRNGNLILGLDGQPAITNIVGLKQDSHWRISPLVLLHTRLFDLPWFADGLHFSAGVTAKADDKGTDVEYLIGPSLSFVQGRLFLTLGAYGGRVQRIEGGLYPGAATPMELTEIPVHKELRWAPGFALSWKIK